MTIRCTNSEPGTFNHECGKPASWAGTRKSGHVQHFCSACKVEGWERHGVVAWQQTTFTAALAGRWETR